MERGSYGVKAPRVFLLLLEVGRAFWYYEVVISIFLTGRKGSLSVQAAIIIAGIIIAGAIIYSVGGKKTETADALAVAGQAQDQGLAVNNVMPVSAEDHIFGNREAPVKLVEYSDTECPFCKRYHETLHEVMKKYNGQVAWVYRHFPLDQLHPRARKEAEATECAAELGGNDQFWKYLDQIFSVTPSNNGLDPAELPRIAERIGLDRLKFEQCLASGKYANKVDTQYKNAVDAGGQGTPFSIIIAANNQKYPLSGAQLSSVVDRVIAAALALK